MLLSKILNHHYSLNHTVVLCHLSYNVLCLSFIPWTSSLVYTWGIVDLHSVNLTTSRYNVCENSVNIVPKLEGNHLLEVYNLDNIHQKPYGIYHNYHHLQPISMLLLQSNCNNNIKYDLYFTLISFKFSTFEVADKKIIIASK